jgi:hypothetical protein
MAIHWAFYFGCSRAMPNPLAATKHYGTFVFFACKCCISVVYVFFALPRMAGQSLESRDSSFERLWYTVRKVAYADLEGSAGQLFDYEKGGAEKVEDNSIKRRIRADV